VAGFGNWTIAFRLRKKAGVLEENERQEVREKILLLLIYVALETHQIYAGEIALDQILSISE
jgi:hypothetical protein